MYTMTRYITYYIGLLQMQGWTLLVEDNIPYVTRGHPYAMLEGGGTGKCSNALAVLTYSGT